MVATCFVLDVVSEHKNTELEEDKGCFHDIQLSVTSVRLAGVEVTAVGDMERVDFSGLQIVGVRLILDGSRCWVSLSVQEIYPSWERVLFFD